MSRRTKREMAPPPNETGFAPHETGRFAPSSQIGSAPTVIQVPTPPAVLGGGSASTGGQAAPWWTGPSPQVTSSVVTSTNCGMDYYPPGGFTSFFQSGQPLFPHVSAPWPPMGKEPQLAPPKADSGNQNPKKKSKGKNIINLEDGNEGRTAKHIVFDPDEDVRLASAWLIHSNDPDKKVQGKMWSVLLAFCKLTSTLCVVQHDLGAQGLLD